MKAPVLLSLFLLTVSLQAQEFMITVSGESETTVEDPGYDMYLADIKNKSPRDVEVQVRSRDTGETVRGFGLNNWAQAEVMVEQENELVFINEGNSTVNLRVIIREGDRAAATQADGYINFTLRNESMKSIPLIIPGVMNPNLSPQSNSGVGLKMGQEIFFKKNGKKHLLLRVDDTIVDGSVIKVAALIKQRERELGLD